SDLRTRMERWTRLSPPYRHPGMTSDELVDQARGICREAVAEIIAPGLPRLRMPLPELALAARARIEDAQQLGRRRHVRHGGCDLRHSERCGKPARDRSAANGYRRAPERQRLDQPHGVVGDK